MEIPFHKTIIERRSKARYPVKLAIRYHILDQNQRVNGVGQALNMSSGGLLVSAQHEVTAGLRLGLNVEWPPLLNGSVSLQLRVQGRVVRCAGSMFAVCFEQCQFGTIGRILKSSDFDLGPTDELPKRLGAGNPANESQVKTG